MKNGLRASLAHFQYEKWASESSFIQTRDKLCRSYNFLHRLSFEKTKENNLFFIKNEKK
ncbi:hypothetical protein Scep_013086 [Stephania cephalantha]|uniref:Uncharacterized protein n=1 Tax=Stephania cephalantha TaxID=152367 RepID=A0AAP0JGC4_9MAGN